METILDLSVFLSAALFEDLFGRSLSKVPYCFYLFMFLDIDLSVSWAQQKIYCFAMSEMESFTSILFLLFQ